VSSQLQEAGMVIVAYVRDICGGVEVGQR